MPLKCDLCDRAWVMCWPGTAPTATPYDWDTAVVAIPQPDEPAVTRCLNHATWKP